MKRILSVFLLLWTFGNCICIAAEREERIPLMNSSNVVYTQQIHYQGNEPYLSESIITTQPLRGLSPAEQFYLQGIEVRKIDRSRSISFFKQSAELGHPLGMLEYGRSLHKNYVDTFYGSNDTVADSILCLLCCCSCCKQCFVNDETVQEVNLKFDNVLTWFHKAQSNITDPILLIKIEKEVVWIQALRRVYVENLTVCPAFHRGWTNEEKAAGREVQAWLNPIGMF